MIRVRLINEGKVVKQITSRLHESVVLAQIEKYKDPFDSVQIVEGDLSEGGKEMLQRVAKKIIPAAMAAGVALGGASGAHAQGGANPNYPGLNYSIGDHVRDIVSPNYRERVRQREHQRSTERQVWDAEQNEIRKQRIAAAKAKAAQHSAQNKVYDQARNSGDGKFIIIYGMDDRVTRIPAKGTEFMPADSQRLAHYITPNGQVYYVRHPHTAGIAQSISKESVTEGFKNTYSVGDRVNTPIGAGKIVFVSPNVNVDGKIKVKLDDPSSAGEDGKYKDTFTFTTTQVKHLDEAGTIGTVGTIPASGTSSAPSSNMQQKTKFAPTGKTTDVTVNDNGELELADPNALDPQTKQKMAQAGLKIAEASNEDSPVAQAIIRRILAQRTDLLSKHGPEAVMSAVDDVAEWVGDVDEIGSSDVSAWVKDVERNLGSIGETVNEAEHGLDAILDQYADSWAKFKAGGDLDENPDFYEALFGYFANNGEMPYGTMKGRTGDPIEWLTMKMDDIAGNDPVAEAEDDDEATAADQAAADKNIIMQIRRAADYEKPTQLELADGTRATIDARTAKAMLAQFDKLRPDSKMMMQQALNTFKGFDELSTHFGGGIRKEAITRVGKIMADAFKESRKGRA